MTRVTVVEPESNRRADVPLPSQDPIIQHLPELCRNFSLLGSDTDLRRWTLSNPLGNQEIPPERSLSDAQIADGAQLWLVPARGESHALVTEDVIEETKGVLDDDLPEWEGATRQRGLTTAAALLVASFAVVAGLAPLPWIGTVLIAGLGALVGLAAMFAASDHPGVLAAPLPSWLVLGQAAAVGLGMEAPGQWMLALTATGVGLALFAISDEGYGAVVAAGITLLSLGAVSTVLLVVGLPVVAVCGILLVVALFGLGLAPQLALNRSSLVRLARAHEDGQSPSREQVAQSVYRGHRVITGVVSGIAVVLGVAEIGLAITGSLFASILALVAAAAFGLRSRLFSRAGHVLPLLLLAVFGVMATALGAMTWLPAQVAPWVPAGVLILGTASLLLAARTTVEEVTAARLGRLLSGLDTLAVIAVPPLAFVAAGGIPWIQSMVG